MPVPIYWNGGAIPSGIFNVIDRFGESVETEIATDKSFFAYVDVALSPTFYSWVFKFGGNIRILSPEKALAEVLVMAHSLINA